MITSYRHTRTRSNNITLEHTAPIKCSTYPENLEVYSMIHTQHRPKNKHPIPKHTKFTHLKHIAAGSIRRHGHESAATHDESGDRTYSCADNGLRFISGRDVSFRRNTICETSWDILPITPLLRRSGLFHSLTSIACLSLNFSLSSAPTSLLLSRSFLVAFPVHSGLSNGPPCIAARTRLRKSKSCASSGSLSISCAERQRLKSSGEGERGRGTSRGSWMNRRGWLGTKGTREGTRGSHMDMSGRRSSSVSAPGSERSDVPGDGDGGG